MSIRLRSSLLLMVQFRKEQSVETFNMEPNFFPLWASRFTRLLGPLSSRTCDCSQKKGVSSEIAHWYLLVLVLYWGILKGKGEARCQHFSSNKCCADFWC